MNIDNIFVINLKKDTKKKEKITIRLNNANMLNKTTFFEAVNGTLIDNNFLKEKNITIYDKWLDPFTKRPITKGEIGCSLSHLLIWNKIVEKNLNNVIILEDDANFNNNLLEEIKKLEIPSLDKSQYAVAAKVDLGLEGFSTNAVILSEFNSAIPYNLARLVSSTS